MSIKKSIPYLSSDYNKILEDFQIEKINCLEKDELLIHLKDQDSWLYDFYLRQKCIDLFVKTGGFLVFNCQLMICIKLVLKLRLNK